MNDKITDASNTKIYGAFDEQLIELNLPTTKAKLKSFVLYRGIKVPVKVSKFPELFHYRIRHLSKQLLKVC